MKELKHEIIIYDGVCVLCNFFIRWILKKDQNYNFKVTNLQSNFTKTHYPEVTKGRFCSSDFKQRGHTPKE
jgi:predicted DCC family thiol-disulfide oxidoreductase YuxK